MKTMTASKISSDVIRSLMTDDHNHGIDFNETASILIKSFGVSGSDLNYLPHTVKALLTNHIEPLIRYRPIYQRLNSNEQILVRIAELIGTANWIYSQKESKSHVKRLIQDLFANIDMGDEKFDIDQYEEIIFERFKSRLVKTYNKMAKNLVEMKLDNPLNGEQEICRFLGDKFNTIFTTTRTFKYNRYDFATAFQWIKKGASIATTKNSHASLADIMIDTIRYFVNDQCKSALSEGEAYSIINRIYGWVKAYHNQGKDTYDTQDIEFNPEALKSLIATLSVVNHVTHTLIDYYSVPCVIRMLQRVTRGDRVWAAKPLNSATVYDNSIVEQLATYWLFKTLIEAHIASKSKRVTELRTAIRTEEIPVAGMSDAIKSALFSKGQDSNLLLMRLATNI